MQDFEVEEEKGAKDKAKVELTETQSNAREARNQLVKVLPDVSDIECELIEVDQIPFDDLKEARMYCKINQSMDLEEFNKRLLEEYKTVTIKNLNEVQKQQFIRLGIGKLNKDGDIEIPKYHVNKQGQVEVGIETGYLPFDIVIRNERNVENKKKKEDEWNQPIMEFDKRRDLGVSMPQMWKNRPLTDYIKIEAFKTLDAKDKYRKGYNLAALTMIELLDRLSGLLAKKDTTIFTDLAIENIKKEDDVDKLLDLRHVIRDYKKVITDITLQLKRQSADLEIKTEDIKPMNKKYMSLVAPGKPFVKNQFVFLTDEGLRIRRVPKGNNTHFDLLKVKREQPDWPKWRKTMAPTKGMLQQQQQELHQPRQQQQELQQQQQLWG